MKEKVMTENSRNISDKWASQVQSILECFKQCYFSISLANVSGKHVFLRLKNREKVEYEAGWKHSSCSGIWMFWVIEYDSHKIISPTIFGFCTFLGGWCLMFWGCTQKAWPRFRGRFSSGRRPRSVTAENMNPLTADWGYTASHREEKFLRLSVSHAVKRFIIKHLWERETEMRAPHVTFFRDDSAL